MPTVQRLFPVYHIKEPDFKAGSGISSYQTHSSAVPEFPLYDLVAQHDGSITYPILIC